MRSKKKYTNKYQHKLIVLISTLNFMNFKFKKYTQKNILYYFNNNLKNNKQKEVKLKTLQSYLYKLEKILKVTMNYYRHLGKNLGTEIYYKLRYSKKECYYKINKYFKDKKEDRFQQRVNTYYKKTCIKNGNVEKWECYYNIYNNKKEEEISESKQSIETLQIKKYAQKCNFKSKGFLSILDLKINKNDKIKLLKAFKKTENYFHNIYKINTIKSKPKTRKKDLNDILKKTQNKLENEGYNKKQLEIQMQKIYELYKSKPHFIIENHKYNDLYQIIKKVKKSVEYTKKNAKKDQNIKNNIFSVLLEQLQNKVDVQILIPTLKEYLNKKKLLEYSGLLNNRYYYELLDLIKNKENYLISSKYKKITT